MTFSINSDDLLSALSTVSGAVPSKATLPILESILFERDGDTLRLAATDLEISIVQSLKVQFASNGEDTKQRVAIPARRLLETLRALPSLAVTLTADSDLNVELTTDQGRYKMSGYDGGDYPALPSLENERAVETDGATIVRAVDKTAFAVSKDALRPAMMGVLFEVRGGSTRVVATDGHRLVKLTMDGITAEEPLDFIVPEKALGLAAKAAPEGSTCTLRVGEGFVEFDYGSTRVIGRMIDEQYPNYDAVIPAENDKTLTVGRSAILAAVKRVALYSSSTTHQIRMALSSDAVRLSAEDIERASDADERVLCDYDAEEMEIGFNAVYLEEVLKNVDAEDAVFSFSTPNRAGVVTPAEDREGEEMLMLIMPVMLNTYART